MNSNAGRLPSRHGSFVRALGCAAQRSVFRVFARSLAPQASQVGIAQATHANLLISLEMHTHVPHSTPLQSAGYTLR